MPEEPTLTHVATTLQFCLEQLQLCEAVAKKNEQLIASEHIRDAQVATWKALDHLYWSGIEPARPQPEGVTA